jgi:hypothetical protein
MKISIGYVQRDSLDTACVHIKPHWLRWLLFGTREREFYVVRSPGHMGGFVWLDALNGRTIQSPRLNRELDAFRADRVRRLEIEESVRRMCKTAGITDVDVTYIDN